MMHEIHIKDLQDLDRAAGEFLEAVGDRKLIAFYAPMAAGKTTFTTAVCKRLGVSEDAVSSPTFAIVNPCMISISTASSGWKKPMTSACTTTWTAAACA